jgi:voltage-gated potassium channel
MKLLNRKPSKTFYEIIMVGLAALSVATIWKKTGYDSYIIWGTWSIFFLDFLYRLYKSESKWGFIKKHPFIVIAAIPLDAVFQFARFARIIHLLRLKSITKYYTMPFIRFLKRQHLLAVTGVTFILVFLLIIPLNLLENELDSYSDAWLSAVLSLTFFGRSGFEPETAAGHTILVIFTILGVIIHGLIISTAFDYLWQSSFIKSFKSKFTNK